MRHALAFFLAIMSPVPIACAEQDPHYQKSMVVTLAPAKILILIKKIYPFYPRRAPKSGTDQEWISGTIFDSSTLALLKRAQERNQIDAVPFCRCQDDGGLQVSIEQVAMTSTKTADVRILLSFSDREHTRKKVVIRIVDTATGWRVHDIMHDGLPSYLDELADLSR